MIEFISLAHAAAEAVAENAAGAEAAHAGLSINPAVVGFQLLNLVALILVLKLILYKPMLKLLAEREKKIKDGVENAEKAEVSLREAHTTRADMMKTAKVETQSLLEKARKDGEGVKNSMVTEAQEQAKKIMDNGHKVLELEKVKMMEELKMKAVGLVVATAEKVIREKMDSTKDAKMIEESLNSFAS